MNIEELNRKYRSWSKREVTGSKLSPMVCISKELKRLGCKRGDEVVVGVREDGVIEIIPISVQKLQNGSN